jgi:hypothetical protein
MSNLLRLAVCASFLSFQHVDAQTFWVDPQYGVDVVVGGTVATPLRTVTFALSQAAPGALTTIHALPGKFQQSSGETFPIVLPTHVEIRAAVPGTADFVRWGGGPLFLAGGAGATAAFHGVGFYGDGTAVEARTDAGWSTTVSFARCRVGTPVGVDVDDFGGGTVDVGAFDSEFEDLLGAPGSVALRAVPTAAHATFDLQRTAIRGYATGVVCAPSGAGATTVRAAYARFVDCAYVGLLAVAYYGSSSHVEVRRSVFYGSTIGLGAGVFGGVGGSCVTLDDSAFDANGYDLVSDPTATVVRHCRLQSASDAASWGATNLSAPCGFVDASAGDFRLVPGSALIDAGGGLDALPPDFDVDGDPVAAGGPRDVGVDEFFPMHVACESFAFGSPANLRLLFTGPAGRLVFLVAGDAPAGVFGGGFRLFVPPAPAIVAFGPLPAGPGPTTQLAFEAEVAVPAPGPFVVWLQAAYFDPNTFALDFSANVQEAAIVP